MTKRQKAVSTLTTAFRAQPAADRRRLKYHEEQRTPICCGRNSDEFYMPDGAG